MGDLHPSGLSKRDFRDAEEVQETLLSFSNVFALPRACIISGMYHVY